MKKLTQTDNGYYNFRRKDNALLRRWRLTIEENTEYVDKKVKEDLIISFALEPDVCTVTFHPNLDIKPMVLMKSGVLVHADHYISDQQFSGRIKKLGYTSSLRIEIENLEKRDSGRFEIRDQDGNLALVLYLEVEETSYSASPQFPLHTHHPNSPIKSSNPTSSSINPPDVQPAGTSYSVSSQVPPPYTYHPINSSEPTSSPLDPPVFSPAGVHMSSSHPQVTPQGTASSVPFGSDSLSSTPEHRFELKGLKFLSAPPLSSDTSF
ncbi:hypothetical protein LDENG_00284640 [Lucifuga dentata]|nr:hypothetical protein LDENG_00284640 [Lucifuga dentata]